MTRLGMFGFLSLLLADSVVPCLAATPKTLTFSSSAKQERIAFSDQDEIDPEHNLPVWEATFTAKKGQAYTVWLEGPSDTNNFWITSDTYPYPEFSLYCDLYSSSYIKRMILEKSKWSECSTCAIVCPEGSECDTDPSDVYASQITYAIRVEGEPGSQLTLHYQLGEIAEVPPVGSEEKPLTIIPKTAVQRTTQTLINYQFSFMANLKAGQKYFFGSVNPATSNAWVDVQMQETNEDSVSWVSLDGVASLPSDGVYADDTHSGISVRPVVDGKYRIVLSSDSDKQATLIYNQAAARAIAKHDATSLTAPLLGGRVQREIQPTYRNNPASGVDDAIIDGQLFKVSLSKGITYVFDAVSANGTPLELEIYDAKGNVLLKNHKGSDNEGEALIAFRPASAGTYWVGVCQYTEDWEHESPDEYLTAMLTVEATSPEDDNALDDAEWLCSASACDTVTYSSPNVDTDISDLKPIFAESGATDALGIDSDGSGTHTFTHTDWLDTFRIHGRKDVRYTVQLQPENYSYVQRIWNETTGSYEGNEVSISSGVVSTYTGVVYQVSGNRMKVVATSTNLVEGLAFDATSNESYYLRVGAVDAQGVVSAYSIHSIASGAGTGAVQTAIGELQVALDIPSSVSGASWSLVSDGKNASKYANSRSIFLTPGEYQVTFAAPSGWKAPTNQTVIVKEGMPPTSITGEYADAFDSKDDQATGATVVVPKPYTQTYSCMCAGYVGGLTLYRSLRPGDDADWFKFTAASDNQYCFLPDWEEGQLSLTLYQSDAQTEIPFKTSALVPLAKGTHYLKVSRADPEFNGVYQFRIGYCDFGVVKFEKTAYQFSENAAAAVVKVVRTGTAGTSVRYSTFAGTAQPNADYVAQTGYLSWEDGDKSARTITIPLIPNLYATWESNKTFSVALKMPEGATYANIVNPSNTVVTLTEVSKKMPGTLGFSGYGEDNWSFDTPKKPWLSVAAGENAMLWIGRTGGSDGRVGVKVETIKGTATTNEFVATTRYLYWEAGDTNAQAFTFSTLAPTNGFLKEKNLTVKLTVDAKAGDKAALGVSTATVAIHDQAVGTTFEDYYEDGYDWYGFTFKCKEGVWFRDSSTDAFRSVPIDKGKTETLTLTYNGCGRFETHPRFVGDSATDSFIVTIDKEKVSVTNEDAAAIVRYLGKGRHTVSFAITRGRNSADDDEVYAVFENFNKRTFGDSDSDYDSFCLWEPLCAPIPYQPQSKDVVSADAMLIWDWDEESHQESYEDGYRLSIAANAKDLGTTNALVYLAQSSDDDYKYRLSEAKLEPGKTYSWRVDAYRTNEVGDVALVATNSFVWTFTIQPESTVTPILKDAQGNELTGEEGILDVSVFKGIKAYYVFGNTNGVDSTTYKIASGKLPDGLRLAYDKAEGVWAISGIPTKTNTCRVAIQAMNGKTVGAMLDLRFYVEELNYAAGTFNGILQAGEGTVSTNLNQQIAFLAFTATDAGRLTAKVSIGTKSYTFTAPSYDRIRVVINETDDWERYADVQLASVVTVGRTKYTNTLDISAFIYGSRSSGSLGYPVTATLTMNLPTADNKGVETNLVFNGNLIRDNSKDDEWLSKALVPWKGYYTVSLPANGTAEGEPQGIGYLTLTLDAKGNAKLAGIWADGTVWSSAAIATSVEDTDSGETYFVVPVFAAKNKAVLGGWLKLRQDFADDGSIRLVADENSLLNWYNADPDSTYGGENGFVEALMPVGGYYDTLFSLQRFYLDEIWKVGYLSSDSLPSELFTNAGTNYDRVVATPENLELTLVGNTVTVAKKSLAKRLDNTKLYDWEASENAANFTVRYTRATGLFNGTFSFWLGDAETGSETVQKEVTNVKYQGVLTPYKASTSGYVSEPGLGSFLVPVKIGKRSWTGSYPFKIEAGEMYEPIPEGWSD